MFDFGTFATGVLTGLGSSALLAAFFKKFIEEGIANWFKMLQQSRDIVGRAEIEYRKQQLAEFYGPIYAFLKGSEVIYRLWIDDKLPLIDEAVKARFREQNNAILSVIGSKSHLIDEGIIPEAMTQFITSVIIWNLYTSQQNVLPVEVVQLPEARFPVEFQRYIYDKTESLKKDLEALYKKYEVK